MTIKDLFEVMWSIREVEFAARDPESSHLLCQFWIGEGCNRDHLPKGNVLEWSKGRYYMTDRKINMHGEPTRCGAEIGWGYKPKSIPDALLNAEITHLIVSNRCGGGYKIYADVSFDPMTVEVLKKTFEGFEKEE